MVATMLGVIREEMRMLALDEGVELAKDAHQKMVVGTFSGEIIEQSGK